MRVQFIQFFSHSKKKNKYKNNLKTPSKYILKAGRWHQIFDIFKPTPKFIYFLQFTKTFKQLRYL